MRRERLEIICDVLSFCSKPRKGYQILFKCNMSYSLLSLVLPALIESECLEVHANSPRVYTTTEKGRQVIKAAKEAFAILQN
jgi:predicted transcriptional regulator